MPHLALDDVTLHYLDDGDPEGAPLVLAHALGTGTHLWDNILPLLPAGLRIIRYDARGHGASSTPPAPYTMGALIRDAERLMDHLKVRDAMFVGLSIGGMVAQGLAVKRPDLIRALVLSNTGAKIATPEIWADRIATARAPGGMETLARASCTRWFPRAYVAAGHHRPWLDHLTGHSPEGYAGCAAAIAGTDFYTTTASLRLSTLGIAGSEDGSTPPDLVRETVDLIPGSQFRLLRGTGHVPPVDAPEAYADCLSEFISATGHIRRR
ncbi:3-oxoadipate enol-lactonase [Roseovarius autotrophicus]|uniref:3-oxoadipate enol-lactonase n=1 Tax=Roseovarius autotrophicus TaxID=2824121 RepID=UPI001A1034F0|nr:3-oxoadipate enol-lactonase [Roseovarius autotrophicus]MBE0454520.1 3-oxoadipate enol-lactonase [Roseovarius sp.]